MINDPPIPPHRDRSETPVDWEALARYLAGECSASESERIAGWLDEHKADAELLTALDNAVASLALRDAADVDVEGALRQVGVRRDQPEAARRLSPSRPARNRSIPRRRVSPWRTVTFLAAAAAIVLAARILLQGRSSSERTDTGTSSARSYATGIGHRDSVRLPDGGRVVLGPASHLVIGAGYGERVREVELHGEAYFDVVHDTTRPFIVRTGDAVVRDIGTSFTVRSDSNTRVQVVVISGSVALRAQASTDSGIVLAAGDVGTLDSSGRVAVRHEGSTEQYLAWMRDSLVFRDASLGEVSSDLHRWYGVVLRVADSSLVHRHLTMTFAGDPVDRVLRVIGLGLGADIERSGDTAIVRRGTRPQ